MLEVLRRMGRQKSWQNHSRRYVSGVREMQYGLGSAMLRSIKYNSALCTHCQLVAHMSQKVPLILRGKYHGVALWVFMPLSELRKKMFTHSVQTCR